MYVFVFMFSVLKLIFFLNYSMDVREVERKILVVNEFTSNIILCDVDNSDDTTRRAISAHGESKRVFNEIFGRFEIHTRLKVRIDITENKTTTTTTKSNFLFHATTIGLDSVEGRTISIIDTCNNNGST